MSYVGVKGSTNWISSSNIYHGEVIQLKYVGIIINRANHSVAGLIFLAVQELQFW